jgi:molybdenum ABC transporter molybdate-binding protein
MKYLRNIVFFIVGLACLPAFAEKTTIAVASNFMPAMRELITVFESKSDHAVRASFGSSGKFYAQISHGAPFDLFFSADQVKPAKLEQEGRSVKGSRFTYAQGALVLWSRETSSELNTSPPYSVKDRLVRGEFKKLAMANPKLAPYGAAALEVLTHLELISSSRRKWVQGENIAQAYQFAASGNAELGFVALSQVLASDPDRTDYWLIPTKLYTPIKQDAVLLARGQTNPAALAFLNFIKSTEAKAIIRRYGYELIDTH